MSLYPPVFVVVSISQIKRQVSSIFVWSLLSSAWYLPLKLFGTRHEHRQTPPQLNWNLTNSNKFSTSFMILILSSDAQSYFLINNILIRQIGRIFSKNLTIS